MNNNNNQEIYVIKTVLWNGKIIKRKIKSISTNGDVKVVLNPSGLVIYYNKFEYEITKKEALKKAEQRKQEKIKELENQLEKLKNLKFKIIDNIK